MGKARIGEFHTLATQGGKKTSGGNQRPCLPLLLLPVVLCGEGRKNNTIFCRPPPLSRTSLPEMKIVFCAQASHTVPSKSYQQHLFLPLSLFIVDGKNSSCSPSLFPHILLLRPTDENIFHPDRKVSHPPYLAKREFRYISPWLFTFCWLGHCEIFAMVLPTLLSPSFLHA